MQSMELTDKNDFGEGFHMASTEPFFYDSEYILVKREYALPIDTNGRCIIVKKVVCTSGEIPRNSAKEPPMKWECSSESKILSDVKYMYMIAFRFRSKVTTMRRANVVNNSKRQYMNVLYHNKGMDLLNLPRILNCKRVMMAVPNYLRSTPPPVVSYTYTRTIAGKIFNHRKVVEELDMGKVLMI